MSKDLFEYRLLLQQHQKQIEDLKSKCDYFKLKIKELEQLDKSQYKLFNNE